MSSSEEEKLPIAGVTTETGQYLAEPALLTWTTHKPKIPGLYAYRKSSNENACIVDVKLDEHTLKINDMHANHSEGFVETSAGEWAGPLGSPT
jgi:hypothetical protein